MLFIALIHEVSHCEIIAGPHKVCNDLNSWQLRDSNCYCQIREYAHQNTLSVRAFAHGVSKFQEIKENNYIELNPAILDT